MKRLSMYQKYMKCRKNKEAYMEEKIEVGEYVRTKDGIIDKVERFSVGCCLWHCENGMCIDECNCIEHT